MWVVVFRILDPSENPLGLHLRSQFVEVWADLRQVCEVPDVMTAIAPRFQQELLCSRQARGELQHHLARVTSIASCVDIFPLEKRGIPIWIGITMGIAFGERRPLPPDGTECSRISQDCEGQATPEWDGF